MYLVGLGNTRILTSYAQKCLLDIDIYIYNGCHFLVLDAHLLLPHVCIWYIMMVLDIPTVEASWLVNRWLASWFWFGSLLGFFFSSSSSANLWVAWV